MNSITFRSIVLAAGVAAALSACQGNDEPQVVSNGEPARDVTQLAAVQVGSTRDPSLPDAGAVLAAQDAADKAKEDAVALQQAAAPQPEAAKGQESNAQPVAGQAPERLSVAPENTKVN